MNALLIVDLQIDFCPGGALPVQEGNLIVPIVNSLVDSEKFSLIVASKDWHPKEHISFASAHPGKKILDTVMIGNETQVLWPDHCVQGSKGAEFVPGLQVERIRKTIHKGTDLNVDSYSAFFDNRRKNRTELEEFLRKESIGKLFICGLATDYCVKFTAQDSMDLGFETVVIPDACRGVGVKNGDVERALTELKNRNVKLIESGYLIS